MVQGRWFPGGSDISLPISLRESVFGRGLDDIDAMAQHVVVYDTGAPVAAARLWWQDGAFWIGDIGVLAEQRDRGFGDLLVRLTLYKALTHCASLIRLECPPEAESFFAQYGFETTGEENGLRQMSILGENVQLSHCGGNCAECGHRSAECVPKALREE